MGWYNPGIFLHPLRIQASRSQPPPRNIPLYVSLLCRLECVIQQTVHWVLAVNLAPWSAFLHVLSHFILCTQWGSCLYTIYWWASWDSEWCTPFWRNVHTVGQLGSGRPGWVCNQVSASPVFFPPDLVLSTWEINRYSLNIHDLEPWMACASD